MIGFYVIEMTDFFSILLVDRKSYSQLSYGLASSSVQLTKIKSYCDIQICN